jgi:hypothetical protein
VARHAKAVSGSARTTRAAALTIVWLAGIGAGFFGLLSASARYTTCSAHSTGLACRHSGTALGVLFVLGVIGTVTAATVTTHDKEPRHVLVVTALGLAALVGWFIAARGLLGTA